MPLPGPREFFSWLRSEDGQAETRAYQELRNAARGVPQPDEPTPLDDEVRGYNFFDEDAMLARVAKDTAEGAEDVETSLNVWVRESAGAGHAKVLALCLQKGGRPDGTAALTARGWAEGTTREVGANGAVRIHVSRAQTHPLVTAIGVAHSVPCVQLLLEAGCEPNGGPERAMSPFFVCANQVIRDPGSSGTREAMVQILRDVTKAGADVHAEEPMGSTVVFKLARTGFHEVLSAVVEKGADIESGPRFSDGRTVTPLAAACRYFDGSPQETMSVAWEHRVATIRTLLRLGAKIVPPPPAEGYVTSVEELTTDYDIFNRYASPEMHQRYYACILAHTDRWARVALGVECALVLLVPVLMAYFCGLNKWTSVLLVLAIAFASTRDLKPRLKRMQLMRKLLGETERLADLMDILVHDGADEGDRAKRVAARARLIMLFDKFRPPLF